MKNLKLSKLNHDTLSNDQMKSVYGGGCTCGCFYANCGGSSVAANGSANAADNLHSIGREGGPC